MHVMMLNITTAETRAVFFEELYLKAFPAAARYIHRQGGNLEDAKDMFHDALVIYYERMVAGKLLVDYSDTAYLTGIVKHLWSKEIKKRGELHNADILNTEQVSESSTQKLLGFIETAGRKCLDMLKAFYYDKMNPEQVAETFGYSGVRSTTVQKYKCLEKLRGTVKEKSLSYADFTE
jgi:DNA-directed RNA polymerase specialized sigma24 family protein